LGTRLRGPQSQAERFGEKTNASSSGKLNPDPASGLVAISTELLGLKEQTGDNKMLIDMFQNIIRNFMKHKIEISVVNTAKQVFGITRFTY
jgi:hypothetical protein